MTAIGWEEEEHEIISYIFYNSMSCYRFGEKSAILAKSKAQKNSAAKKAALLLSLIHI